MAPNYLSSTWCVEAFPKLGVQGVEGSILVGASSLLNGGKRREGKEKEKRKEKNHHGEGGFLRAGSPPYRLCNGPQLLGAIKG
jgi:hypothetical protein